jgi:uncharacterized membrane protein YdbT with pleckstrin-like domain
MDLVEHLRRIPLFSHLDSGALLALSEMIDYQEIAPGTRLARQADLGATFYIVDYGEAVIHRVDERGIQRPLGMLAAGESFGTTSLFLGEPRDATVTAVTAMGVWSLRRQDLEAFLSDHPDAEDALIIPEEIRHKLGAPRFPWLQPGEFVALHSHRHWIVLARAMVWSSLLFVGYSALALWLQQAAGWRLLALWLPAVALYGGLLAWRWIDWRNDYFSVTTQRITHRERVAFVYESRNEVPLDRVQNINMVARGLGQLLGYGTITVETAAALGKVVFDRAPHPEAIRDAIWAQLARAQATRRAAQRHLIREALASHMGLDPGEPESEAELGQERPLELVDLQPPEVRPGALMRAFRWLSEQDLIPRVRIETDESVTWRKHWVFLLADVVWPFLLSIASIVLAVLGFFGFPAQLTHYVYYPGIMLMLAVLTTGWLWWSFNDWGNDLYIVTDERIIDIEKRPLFFSEQRREASLGMIQNVSLRIPNITASVLNYGDVIVQTAGAGDFTFVRVPNPREVQTQIFQRLQAFRLNQQEREADRRRAELAEWFSVYGELIQGQPKDGDADEERGTVAEPWQPLPED